MHFLSNEQKEKWVEEYDETDTTGATKRVQDAVAAVQQQQEDTKKAENDRSTNREPEMTFQEIMDDIGDSLSDYASSNDGADRADENDEQTEQGQLRNDDEPSWVMGSVSKMVQQRMEKFWKR